MSAGSSGHVVVVGSANRDYLTTLDRLPRPGETVLGAELTVGCGGKGANQAIAAAAAGARCALVACVGDDVDGRAVLSSLSAALVDVGEVSTVSDVRTGTAFVLVTGDGQNSIVVAPGANARLQPAAVTAALGRLVAPGDVLVTQAEIPVETVVAAVETATGLGARVVLNLAPFTDIPATALALADPLVVNEMEAGALVGREIVGVDAARAAAMTLLGRARSVVVTVGAQGAVVAAVQDTVHVVAEAVDVVDSTGAGDCFTGALAAALSRGDDLVAAVRCGVVAGTSAVGHLGAQRKISAPPL